MKGRGSKLGGKISMSGKYYPIEALRCESVKFGRSKSLEKERELSGFRRTLLLCCKKGIPHIVLFKRRIWLP